MQVSATTWSTLSKLLDEALDLEPAARDTWLERLSVTQPQLAPSMRRLLAAHASSETADVLAQLPSLDRSESSTRVSSLAPGDRIGPYRLKREIGAGGMADVWLAERADGAFTREVALKLPLINRLRRDLAQRFARERDILARLEHPHIARLYDAGVTEDGLPYLAMEYVDGQPITTYCDTQRLGVAERLRLFAQVLDAVQFAHASLVIHRDIKPSNILVTTGGEVRLLDFGIAKLLADSDTVQETQLTQLSGRALTPDYASPEQIKGEPLTIATDLYSLGVVLYELLVGSRPYRLRVQSAAQLEQAIIDAEPLSPSSAATVESAEARSTSQPSLVRALTGDLDTIVLKTLAKIPAERYSTVAEFAQDLSSHLAGLPVRAQRASWRYRAGKFVFRNRLAVGAAGTIALILVASTAVSIWQARVAIQQTAAAQRETKRAEAVQNFLLDIFRANTDQQTDPVKARNTTARELLDIGAQRMESALQDAPEPRADVMKTLAEMYYQLGLEEQSASIEGRRVELLKQMYGPHDQRVAEALIKFATALAATKRRAEILPALEEAKTILDASGDNSSRLRGELLTRLAQRNQNISYDKMFAYADEAVRILRPYQTATEDRLSTALHFAARSRVLLGDFAAAEPLYRESITELEKNSPVPQVPHAQTLVYLAESQSAQLKIDAAEQSYRKALLNARGALGADDVVTIQIESRLAAFLHSTARREEALQLHQDALRKVIAVKGDGDTLHTPQVRMDFGRSLLAEGRLQESEPLINAVIQSNRRHYAGSAVLGFGIRTQALLETALGRYDQARRSFSEGFAMWQKSAGPSLHPSRNNRFLLDEARLDLALGDANGAISRLRQVAAPKNAELLPLRLEELERDIVLAHAYLSLGDVSRALSIAEESQKQLVSSPLRQYYPASESEASLTLGRAQLRTGDPHTARASLERSLNLRLANDSPASPSIAEAQIALADCFIALGEQAQARSLVKRAAAIQASHIELGDHYKKPLIDVRRRLGMTAGA
jgi:eukaryotic-like serine/threonine-protein kinase